MKIAEALIESSHQKSRKLRGPKYNQKVPAEM